MIPYHANVRKTLLTLVILAPTSALPMLFPISPAEVPSMLSENASFAGFSIGQPMNNNDNDNDDLRQLAHILGDAYRNALMHDTPNEDLEAQDLRLESASIRLSSRLLYETTKGSCQSDEHAAIGTVADRTCVLDDESLGLRGLTDMLSYAAVDLRVWAGRFLPPIAQTASVLCSGLGSNRWNIFIEWSSQSRGSILIDRRVPCTWKRHASNSDGPASTWKLNIDFVHAVTMRTQHGCRNYPRSRTG